MYRFFVLIIVLLFIVGCSEKVDKVALAPVIISQGPPQRWDVGDHLIKSPLPEGADDYYLQFFKAPGYSFGIFAARKIISARSHNNHDLVLYVHRGNARFHVGDKDWIAGTGDVIYIPRGAVYSAESMHGREFNFFAVYHPQFDGKDIVYIDPEENKK